jgi:hypothetical protein
MNLHDIIRCADANAGRVWAAAKGPQAFTWWEALPLGPGPLAQWAAGHPTLPASSLYAFATAQTDAAPWSAIPPALRCALETFRATVVVLHAEREAIKAGFLGPVPGCRMADNASTSDVPPGPPVKAAPHPVTGLETAWDADTGRPARKGKRT